MANEKDSSGGLMEPTNLAHSTQNDDAVELKRRAARRRFLTGGAAALPLIVSARNARATTVIVGSLSLCESLGEPTTPPPPGTDPDPPPPGPSLACEIAD